MILSEKELKYAGNECFIVGNKIMSVCPKCKKLVRIDKPIFRDFHICCGEEDGEGIYGQA